MALELFIKQEPRYEVLILGLTFPKNILEERIKKRLKDRLEKEDMLGEVKRLKKEGISWKRLESQMCMVDINSSRIRLRMRSNDYSQLSRKDESLVSSMMRIWLRF